MTKIENTTGVIMHTFTMGEILIAVLLVIVIVFLVGILQNTSKDK